MNKTTRCVWANMLIGILIVSSAYSKGSNVAHYDSGEEGTYWKQWTCLEGIETGEEQEEMKAAFENELLSIEELWESTDKGAISIGEEERQWKTISSESDVIDFKKLLEEKDHVYTYALAEVYAAEEKELYLGVASDDAVKVWINGQLVHEHWVFRGVGPAMDLVPVTLKKGANQVAVKVLNGTGGWALKVSPLTQEKAEAKFADGATVMDLDSVDGILKSGIPIDSRNDSGLTALQNARIAGLSVRIQQLIERGADPSIPMPDPEKTIPHFFKSGVDPESAGLSYLVSKGGKIISEGAYGMADAENGIPLTSESKFRIGSITKQFTAAAILLLQEEGKLSIEDPLNKYIEDFPRGDEVTLRMMLNHTSGIHSYTSESDFISGVTKPIKTKDMVAKIKGYEYDFEPGTAWAYSNSGFYLLGYLVEKISGKELGAYWEDNLFGPLGMKNTGAYVNGTSYENEALGHGMNDGKTELAMDWDMTHAGGAGVIYSTVGDMYRWNEALFGGKVLSEASFMDATTPGTLVNGEEAGAMGGGYGLGLMTSELRGLKTVQHGGGLHGFATLLMRVVEEELTLVVFTNSRPSTLTFQGSSFNRAAMLAMDLPPVEDLDISDTESDESWNEYVGRYDYGRAINTITFEDGHLYTQLTGQSRFELFKASGDRFYLKVVAAECEFERDDSGEVVGLKHTQNGRPFSVKKLAPVVVAEVDPQVYDLFLGDYQLTTRLIVTISKDGDRLFSQATGQSTFELLPLSKFEYSGKGINIKIVFNPNEAGSIDAFTLYQNGAVMKAPRL